LAGLVGELANLHAGAMDERHADAQTSQEGDVEEQIAEVLALHDAAVERNDEDAIAILRHVVQHLTQVGKAEHAANIDGQPLAEKRRAVWPFSFRTSDSQSRVEYEKPQTRVASETRVCGFL